ncbi:hypothetical protein ABB27_17320 [Stenotrophomonas terrae]|uniref:Uncharacterized protein n=1 Tax=Stenotrophomonas terrae TaxID=405446 RepID=A0A0R0C1N5_9GAMM|nr:hypothetical protein [Stenotrophomonas terrae]KRG63836.1 hypothetical protein ABB27_17320 [Stenotrophomonas terrae]
MSQFLLVQSAEPSTDVAGVSFHALSDELLVRAASHNFGTPFVWSLTDESDGIDSMSDAAKNAIAAGAELQDTLLGQLLLEQIELGRDFCLFWGGDFQNLPVLRNSDELMAIISEQLHSDGAWNWEIYALWKSPEAGSA